MMPQNPTTGTTGRARILSWRPTTTLVLDPTIPYRTEPVEVLTRLLQHYEEIGNPFLDPAVQMSGVYLRDPLAGGALRFFLRPELTQRAMELVKAVAAGDVDQACIDWLKAHGGPHAK